MGILDDGYSVPVCEINLRPGGKWRFVGKGPKGQAPDFYGEYREIAPPERLVYTEIFAPFPDVVSVVTSVLTEEQGKTRLTVSCHLSVEGCARHGGQHWHGARRGHQLRPARGRGPRAGRLSGGWGPREAALPSAGVYAASTRSTPCPGGSPRNSTQARFMHG